MILYLDIRLDNAAFEECNGNEIARILHNLATTVEGDQLDEYYSVKLLDHNGNAVGSMEVFDK